VKVVKLIWSAAGTAALAGPLIFAILDSYLAIALALAPAGF